MDDICLLSQKHCHIAKADRLVTLARVVCLEININKNKAMSVNHNNANYILLNGCPLEFVESFCTLDKDVDCRINKARVTF